MKRIIKTWLPLVSLAAFVAGCAVQKYAPAPIRPSVSAEKLASRSLNDPGLREFIRKSLGRTVARWPADTWNMETLSLAAFYFNPQMALARAKAQTARAAILAAGARPNPTLGFMPGVPSPYLMGLTLAIPIETHGKRGIRIAEARNLSEAARTGLAIAAWKVRSQVRAALVQLFVAQSRMNLLQAQGQLLAKKVGLLQERLVAGEISRPQVDLARVSELQNEIALQTAKGEASLGRAGLAAAIGVPVSALREVRISWTEFAHPPAPDALSAAKIQSDAVLNRLDIREALVQYAAAEDALHLEIARQYPNISIGPGYQYEESHHYFTLGLSSVIPLFNRNQGPIAEAEGRRKQAAANFLAVQAQGIAQSEAALAAYRSAFSQLADAKTSLGRLQGQRQGFARASVSAGESGQLTLNGVLLEGSASSLLELNALARTQAAFGALEDSVERPLGPEQLPENLPANHGSGIGPQGVKP